MCRGKRGERRKKQREIENELFMIKGKVGYRFIIGCVNKPFTEYYQKLAHRFN